MARHTVSKKSYRYSHEALLLDLQELVILALFHQPNKLAQYKNNNIKITRYLNSNSIISEERERFPIRCFVCKENKYVTRLKDGKPGKSCDSCFKTWSGYKQQSKDIDLAPEPLEDELNDVRQLIPRTFMNIPSPEEAHIRFHSIYKASVTRVKPRYPMDDLDRGTRVLSDETECIRYIALYGGHHFHKLYAAFASTNFKNIEGRNVEIIDWGCGQAIATCILIDYFIENNINLNVLSITLIEPSKISLQRGHSLVRRMFQHNASTDSVVRMVNKYLDDLTPTDLVTDSDSLKIHLFSNIIDVEGFDLKQLYQLMVDSFRGLNRVICTSPDNGRQQRLETFYNLFLKSHQITRASSSNEAIYGELFYVKNERYEERRIGRCETQFTVNLTQS